MKLAISNIAWRPQENETIYSLLQNLGVSCLEVAPGLLTQSPQPYSVELTELTKLREKLHRQFNLSLVSMQSLLFGSDGLYLFKEKSSRTNLFNYLKKSIDFASALGINNLVFGSPKNRALYGRSVSESMNIARSFFSELSYYGEEKKVYLSLEANPAAYGTDFMNTNKQAADFVRELNLPHMRLNYDLGAVQMNSEDFKPFLAKNMDLIEHIHFSQPNLAAFPGREISFFRDVMKELKINNYKKVVSIEMRAVSQDNNTETVKQALENLIALYREA